MKDSLSAVPRQRRIAGRVPSRGVPPNSSSPIFTERRFKNGARTALSACSCFQSKLRADKAVRAPSLRFSLLLCQLVFAYHATGQVIAWGENNAGQATVPAGLTNVVAVAGGGLHSLALRADGTVAAWGFNVSGQTNVPATLTNAIAIAAGNAYSMALTSNGTVTVWGGQSAPPPGLSNATGIAAGWDHSLALKSDGTVLSWGSQSAVPAPVTNIIAIAAGNSNSLALKIDGTVLAWGNNAFGKAVVPPAATNVTAISAGQDHCLALKIDGTVVGWGGNYSGQINIPNGLTNVVAVAAGAAHSLALKNDGTLVGWGDNTYGQASTNSGQPGFFSIACGFYHSLALRGAGAPAIVIPPLSQTVFAGKPVTFRVAAAGTLPLTYQWQKNATNILGATNSTFSLGNVQPADAATYTVSAANSSGSAVSPGAILTVLTVPPFVTTQPSSQTILCGDDVSFQVVADGSIPVSYQWQFGGKPISNATQSILNLSRLTPTQAGGYSVVLTNAYGANTSAVATLTVLPTPPAITSPAFAQGKQGVQFLYPIIALHSPITFGVGSLPFGLTFNATSGIISGIPQESGTLASFISAANACAFTSAPLTITITSSVPVITSPTNVTGGEQTPIVYTVTATESPAWFGGQNLPVGLSVNPTNGIMSGQPAYAGEFDALLLASNIWGIGSAPLHFTITNIAIGGFSIATNTFVTNYSSPYLLDFMFSLRDNADPTFGGPLITDPTNLTVVAMEDGITNSPTETTAVLDRARAKLIKCFLVLDFTESVASLSNGNSYGDGISDAVHAMVAGAQDFVNQLAPDAQIGVYEFHRDDEAPNRVLNLTTDKKLLDQSIAGIWTNYVQWFPAGSRCWDALTNAIADLGPTNRDEQHFIVFVSDGSDQSSTATSTNVITAAQMGGIRLYCIGFGSELDPNILGTMAVQTQGAYYDGRAGLTVPFDQIGRELSAQYILRWATLKRSSNPFQPSFLLGYQGFVAWATNVIVSNAPVGTNPPTFTTNTIIPAYVPTQHTGTVTLGLLRLIPDAVETPKAVTLRASYVPRYVRQIRIHYQPNWPCIPTLLNTNPAQILYQWRLTETNGPSGDRWLTISSPNPSDLTTSIPFAALGNLIHFSMKDMVDSTNAFSFFTVDNSIYTVPTNGPSFNLDTNLTSFITSYPALPYSTPVPWLIAHGFAPGQPASYYIAAELADSDNDGALNWQEYRANTDPQDPTSKFFIRKVTSLSDGRHQITFTSALNRTYRLDSALSIPPDWNILQDNIPGTGADITITDTRYLPGVTSLLYRVLVY